MSDETVASGAPVPTSRRALLAGAGALGATAVLAACGTDPEDSARDPYSPAPPVPDPGASAGESGDKEDSTAGGESDNDGEALVAASEVAVGGGVILADQGVVVTQPSEGEWKAFSATCTHQGCTVSEIRGETIYCACHGSEFSLADGSPVAGPAPSPLAERAVTSDGDNVYLA